LSESFSKFWGGFEKMFQNGKQVGIHLKMTNILWIFLISLMSFDRLKVFEKNVFMSDFTEKSYFIQCRRSTIKSVCLNWLTRTMKCMSIYCPLNMCKCNCYISFNICINNNMPQLAVPIFLTCLNWQFTYFISIHTKQHFTKQHAFHIFNHKSFESDAHQLIIITLMAYKSHTGLTHSLKISYSQ
jgi:hypothetical protein